MSEAWVHPGLARLLPSYIRGVPMGAGDSARHEAYEILLILNTARKWRHLDVLSSFRLDLLMPHPSVGPTLFLPDRKSAYSYTV